MNEVRNLHDQVEESPMPGMSSSQAFKKFFRERNEKKKKEYSRITGLGFQLGLGGLIMTALATLCAFTKSVFNGGGWLAYIFFAQGLGALILTLGVVLVSVVPADHINIEEALDGRKHSTRRMIVVNLVGLLCFLFMVVVVVMPPYAMQVVMAIISLFILDDKNVVFIPALKYIGWPEVWMPPEKFCLKLAIYLLLAPALFAILSIYLAIDVDAFLKNCLMPGNCADTYIEYQVKPAHDFFRIVYFTTAPILIVLSMIGMKRYNDKGDEFRKAKAEADADGDFVMPIECDESSRLLDAIYIVFLGYAVIAIAFNVNFMDYETSNLQFWYQLMAVIEGISQLVVILVVYIVGKENVFGIIDGYFEPNIDSLMKDGSLLAELAANSEKYEEGDYYWIYHAQEREELKSDNEEHVRREFYTKAEVIEKLDIPVSDKDKETKRALHVKVDVREEYTQKLYYKFNEVDAVEDEEANIGVELSAIDSSLVDKWIKDNFSESCETGDSQKPQIQVTNQCEAKVTLKIPLPFHHTTEKGLLEHAKAKLRAYELNPKNIPEDIFKKSPREIKKDEYGDTYAKSSRHDVHESGKIDFFISHTWEGTDRTKEQKKKFLKNFAVKFYFHHGRYPKVWIDKYCIDQKEPGNDMAVIPIYINCCNKVLVLLTDEYLKRVWCIWEMYCLFIYFKKEIAVQKLMIVPVGADEDEDEDGRSCIKSCCWSSTSSNSQDHRESTTAELGALKNFVEGLKNCVDNAHAFSPNEEKKLRTIMYNMGKENLETLTEEIKNMVTSHQLANKRSEQSTASSVEDTKNVQNVLHNNSDIERG